MAPPPSFSQPSQPQPQPQPQTHPQAPIQPPIRRNIFATQLSQRRGADISTTTTDPSRPPSTTTSSTTSSLNTAATHPARRRPTASSQSQAQAQAQGRGQSSESLRAGGMSGISGRSRTGSITSTRPIPTFALPPAPPGGEIVSRDRSGRPELPPIPHVPVHVRLSTTAAARVHGHHAVGSRRGGRGAGGGMDDEDDDEEEDEDDEDGEDDEEEEDDDEDGEEGEGVAGASTRSGPGASVGVGVGVSGMSIEDVADMALETAIREKADHDRIERSLLAMVNRSRQRLIHGNKQHGGGDDGRGGAGGGGGLHGGGAGGGGMGMGMGMENEELLALVQASLAKRVAKLDDDRWMFEREGGEEGYGYQSR